MRGGVVAPVASGGGIDSPGGGTLRGGDTSEPPCGGAPEPSPGGSWGS